MPPRLQVRSLDDISLKCFKTVLKKSCLNQCVLKAVEEYISSANYQIVQSLLAQVIQSQNISWLNKVLWIKALLRADVRKLDLSRLACFSPQDDLLKLVSKKCTNLLRLDLSGISVMKYDDSLYDVFCNLKKLQSLVFPALERDEDCDDVYEDDMINLGVMQTLTSSSVSVLDIGSYWDEISEEYPLEISNLAGCIYVNFPNLKELKSFSFSGVGLRNIENNNQIDLRYIKDRHTDMETLSCISELCPNLQAIHLLHPEENVVKNLSELKNLTSINVVDFKFEHFLESITPKNSKIVYLCLNTIKDYYLDLSVLSNCLPSLKILECFSAYLTSSESNFCMKNLEAITIRNCIFTTDTIIEILKNTKTLTKFWLDDPTDISDKDFKAIMESNDFSNLKEMWLNMAPNLTGSTAEMLLMNCPCLTYLGKLSGWDVSAEEAEDLRYYVKENNFDLRLYPDNLFCWMARQMSQC